MMSYDIIMHLHVLPAWVQYQGARLDILLQETVQCNWKMDMLREEVADMKLKAEERRSAFPSVRTFKTNIIMISQIHLV